MEHVRMIITAHQAILPADDEASEIVQRFMSGLQALIQHRLRYTNGGWATGATGALLNAGAQLLL
jgi:hypothetical protein